MIAGTLNTDHPQFSLPMEILATLSAEPHWTPIEDIAEDFQIEAAEVNVNLSILRDKYKIGIRRTNKNCGYAWIFRNGQSQAQTAARDYLETVYN